MRTFKRTAATTVLAVTTLLALTGCIKMEADLTVGADDTIDGTIVLGVSKDAVEMMGQDPADPTLFDDMVSDVPEGATSTPFQDDDFTGIKYTFDGMTFAHLAEQADEGALQFAHEGDTITFSGELADSEDAVDYTALGLTAVDVRMSVTFPGPVTESNGTVDGNTVTWKGDLSEPLVMTASAKDGPSNGAVLIVYGVGALVVIGVIVGGVVWVRRRDDGGGDGVDGLDEASDPYSDSVSGGVVGEVVWSGQVPDDLAAPYED